MLKVFVLLLILFYRVQFFLPQLSYTKGRLDRNLFSLTLPREEGDYVEILFGFIDHDLYVGELKSLPLLKEAEGRWGVAANRLEIDDGEGFILGLEGGTAVFETDSPFVGLPEKYVKVLEEKLGMESTGKGWDSIRSIDCSR